MRKSWEGIKTALFHTTIKARDGNDVMLGEILIQSVALALVNNDEDTDTSHDSGGLYVKVYITTYTRFKGCFKGLDYVSR